MGRRRLMPIAFAVVLVASSTASAGRESAPGKTVPAATSQPSISGSTIQDQSVSSSSGSWDGPSSTYTYQWVRCSSTGTSCSPIGAATAQTYKLASTEVGSTLRVVVTASNKNGSAVGTSNATAIVVAAAPPAPTTTTSATTTSATTTSSSTTSTPTPSTTPTTTAGTTTSSTTTTTVPTTTTTPPPTGTVAFRGDWESGTLAPWAQVQCLNYSYLSNAEFTRGNVFNVGDTFVQGSRAGRFDLPASSNKSACEVAAGPYSNGIGNDTWYSLETRFPSNWQEPSSAGWGLTITQLHFQWPGIWAGPLQLMAHADRVDASLQSGRCAFGTGCSTNLKPLAVPVGQLTPGVWHQFVIHAHWAVDSTGVVEIWWRRKGEATWNQTVHLTGVPTLQLDLNGNLISTETYDKIGAYRGSATFPLSVWHDGYCRATSFSAATSCLG